MMISKFIIFLLVMVQVSYSLKLNKQGKINSKLQLIFEVEDDLIGISNYIQSEKKDYLFIDSTFNKIIIVKPKNYEIIDSVLEINLMDKEPNYSYYKGKTEIIIGGCCSYPKGKLIYLEFDSILVPIKYIKVGYNKYSGFQINK